MNIVIESAIELTKDQKQSLAKKLNHDQIEFKVDPNLIGGLRVISPQKILDLSLKARLAMLKQNLNTQ